MLNQIQGLHHVTSFAGSAAANNRFLTKTLGLRRVKKTVNFDAPDVYHLYYGDAAGTPGTIMTYFPFPDIAPGKPGVGEVGTTVFAVPEGALAYWKERLAKHGVAGLSEDQSFGARRLHFTGADGDSFALLETADDPRAPWTGSDVPEQHAIRGFHSTMLRLKDDGATAELLKFMGYRDAETRDGVRRMLRENGNGAHVVDIETFPSANMARPGSGSVHHLAFAVENREKQLEVRKALLDTGYVVTPVIDRDYFWSIYFRTPGGVLFEVATNEPGFARDEEPAHLGEALKLPEQHAHLRASLEKTLEPITDGA
jgi:glyoxalase family protein